MSKPVPNSGVLDIDAYVPGKSAVPVGIKLHKLSANETPLGPSLEAKAAFLSVAERLEDYPDGSSTALRQALAKSHGIHADNILCGNGSDDCLSLLAKCYLRPGDEAIYSEHGFLVYKIEILACGAVPVVAPETDLHTDVDAILAKVNEKTKMVFVANPNNPTGTYLPMSEVRRLHAGLRDDIVLVLDAAYAEYVRRNDYEAGIELVAGSQNVVMTRTFSKIYGLAALRVGWMFGPSHIIDACNRVRGPFNVNAAASAAAIAAVSDRKALDNAIVHNDHWLSWCTQELTKLGLKVTPSVGNFLLMHFPEGSQKDAEGADAYLTQRGFVLRRVTAYGFPNAIRMSVGSEEACRGAIACLAEYMGEAE